MKASQSTDPVELGVTDVQDLSPCYRGSSSMNRVSLERSWRVMRQQNSLIQLSVIFFEKNAKNRFTLFLLVFAWEQHRIVREGSEAKPRALPGCSSWSDRASATVKAVFKPNQP